MSITLQITQYKRFVLPPERIGKTCVAACCGSDLNYTTAGTKMQQKIFRFRLALRRRKTGCCNPDCLWLRCQNQSSAFTLWLGCKNSASSTRMISTTIIRVDRALISGEMPRLTMA